MPTSAKRVTNVLLTCPLDTGVGGVQVVLRDLVHALEQTGRQVYFIYGARFTNLRLVEAISGLRRRAFYCPMPAVVKNSGLLSLPVFLAYLPITLFHLTRLIRRKKIDVVNCHYLDAYFIHLVIAARLMRVPVVISVHGAEIDGYTVSSSVSKFVYRLIMRGAHRIVACSEALARQTIEVFPDVRQKVTYVHNGLDLSHYGATSHTPVLPGPFLLCACRHVRKKGVDTLLQAFALICRECPTLTLVLLGDGPLLEEHKSLAQTLGIERRVVFVGSVAHGDVSAFFQACSLFVLPSRAEPFGLVLLEAAYHKRAIVCTRVGGVPEIITNGVNGVLVEPDDPAGMAAHILALLRNPELAERLGVQAYETLMARFLWKDRIHDYIAIYEGRNRASPIDANPTSGAFRWSAAEL
ncbi:MAG: glycosyltransferase family 4 protein [Acidobacteriota bacterium]